MNAGPASLRRRVWAGASMKSICLTITLAIGADLGRAQGLEIFGRWRALGGEAVQDGDDIFVARDDPGVEVRVPVDGIVRAQAVIERIGIGQHLRDRGGGRGSRGASARLVRHLVRPADSMHEFLFASAVSRATSADRAATVGAPNSCRRVNFTPNMSRMRATSCTPSMEWPPIMKKFSSRFDRWAVPAATATRAAIRCFCRRRLSCAAGARRRRASGCRRWARAGRICRACRWRSSAARRGPRNATGSCNRAVWRRGIPADPKTFIRASGAATT